ncbi:MAG: pilus assembly PilX N-terminal domain-containing protein [bacterium]|nr:pilus assembly PilX N-terminal domain-containing protein [bacterium]
MRNQTPIALNRGQAPRLDSGQAMMMATLFFLVVSVTMIFGLVGPVLRQQKISSNLVLSRQSYFLAEAGLEDVVYRLSTGQPVSSTEVLNLSGSTATIVTTDTLEGKQVIATADVQSVVRKVETNLTLGDGAAFYYGVQTGQGGFIIGNATVNGSVYSNGAITGANGAKITGSAVSAESSGLIDNIDVGQDGVGEAWSHTVKDSIIAGALYCQVGQSNDKSCDTTRPDAPMIDFPITDAQMAEWKADALLGGTIGSYNPSVDASLGPKKISGNMTLDDVNLDLTINGVVHVTGDVDLSNNQGSVRCASAFTSNSCMIIADGSIHIKNNITFAGSGQAGSFLLLASTLDCDGTETQSPTSGKLCGHHNSAIDLHNNSIGSIIYASHGKLYLHPGVNITGATAYRTELENNAVVNYNQGLINAVFSSGPSGGYEIQNWKEIE